MKATEREIQDMAKLALARGGTVSGGAPLVASKVSEKEFQAAVVREAKRLAWRVYHVYEPRKSAAGWPDLVCLRGGVMIVAELKVPPNKTTPDQEQWLEDFRELAKRCSVIKVFVWRPEDWARIMETLA